MRNFKTNQRFGGGFKLAPKGVKPAKCPFEVAADNTSRIKLPPNHIVHITSFKLFVLGKLVKYGGDMIVTRNWRPWENEDGGMLIVTTSDGHMLAFEVRDGVLHLPTRVSDVEYVPVKEIGVHVDSYRYKLLDVYAANTRLVRTESTDWAVQMCEQYHRPTEDPNVVEIVTRPNCGRVPDDYVIFKFNIRAVTLSVVDCDDAPLAIDLSSIGIRAFRNNRQYRNR